MAVAWGAALLPVLPRPPGRPYLHGLSELRGLADVGDVLAHGVERPAQGYLHQAALQGCSAGIGG